MKTDKKQNAFTLIELLVVIAIIALLMSILLPALAATKRQALKTICITHLSQWGMLFSLYAEDNDDMFFAGFYEYSDPNGISHDSPVTNTWPYVMQPYYENPKLKFCPAARQDWNRSFSSRSSWGENAEDIFSGSYGLNGWICNPPKVILENQGHDTRNNWRTLYPKGNRSQIPLMADAYWFTGLPEDNDIPEKNEENSQVYDWPIEIDIEDNTSDELVLPTDNQMRRFCVDRHRNRLNVLFLDGSIMTLSPKKLWRLKWNREFDTNAPFPEWPEWMRQFKDPE